MHIRTLALARFLAFTAAIASFNRECFATEYYLIADVPVTATSVTSSDAVNFSAIPGRSYCLEIQTRTGSVFAAVQGISFFDANIDGTFSDRGDASPPVYSPSIIFFSGRARRCFRITSSGTVNNYRLRATLTFTTGTTAGETVFRLFDTTLTGGFNTSVTDFNFLELTNTLSRTNRDAGAITAVVTARNVLNDSEVLASEYVISAGDRIDVNIHDAVGPGVFGIVSVTHNGPAGSLKGVLSQYRLISLNPFDFEPVLQQQLLRAVGLP